MVQDKDQVAQLSICSQRTQGCWSLLANSRPQQEQSLQVGGRW